MFTQRPWWTFVLLSATFFMLIVDFSIVSVALPALQHGLHVRPAESQWTISAYTIVFAGFLMLTGRLADLFGRRRLLIAGLALFVVASLIAGLAPNINVLIAMRAIQGLGAAIVNPAALALVTTLFPPGETRNRALGYWGVIGSAGLVAGMLLGGVLTSAFGWRSIFFVNVPVGLIALALMPVLVARDQPSSARPKLDIVGAILLTGGLSLLVYTIVRIGDDGFASMVTLMRGGGAIVLLALFVFVEARVVAPLIPARLFRYPDLVASSFLSFGQVCAYVSIFVFASLYLQDVNHFTALLTGLAFLPSTLCITLIAGPSSAPLAKKFGARPVAIVGSLAMIAGSLLLARSGTPIPYMAVMLPGLVIMSMGAMYTYEMSMIAGLAHVSEDDDGVAAALLSTTVQVGVGLGVAVSAAATIATGQLSAAFWSAAVFSVMTLLSAIFVRHAGAAQAMHIHIPFGKLVHVERKAS